MRSLLLPSEKAFWFWKEKHKKWKLFLEKKPRTSEIVCLVDFCRILESLLISTLKQFIFLEGPFGLILSPKMKRGRKSLHDFLRIWLLEKIFPIYPFRCCSQINCLAIVSKNIIFLTLQFTHEFWRMNSLKLFDRR